MRIHVTAVLLLTLLSAGCAKEAYLRDQETGGMGDGYLAKAPGARAELTESLFVEDQKVISNEDIQRVLAAKITLSDDAKLAVVRAGRLPHWFGWSEDFTRMNREIDRKFLEKIGGAKRVRQAVYLPSMAVPPQMSIPHLRQSAARFQADLILVYRTYSRTYEREKLFSAGETRAYCTLEALLIDTRTGVIPFSTIVTEDFAARRTRDDVDFSETIAKAEQQAIARAQLAMAEQVVQFSNGLGDPTPR